MGMEGKNELRTGMGLEGWEWDGKGNGEGRKEWKYEGDRGLVRRRMGRE